MPTRSDNTFQEGLIKLNRLIADLKAEPDSNLEFLAALETMVLEQLRAPIDAIQAMGLTNAPSLASGAPPAPGGMPTLGPGGGDGPPPGPPPPGVPGVASLPGAGMPNPDELRRMLGGMTQ